MNQFEEHLLCESLSKNVVRQDFLVLKLGDVSVTLFLLMIWLVEDFARIVVSCWTLSRQGQTRIKQDTACICMLMKWKFYFASWCCLIGFWMLSVFLALHESKNLRRWFPTLQHTTTSKHLFQGCIHWKKWVQNISCTSLLRCISQSFNHKSLPLRVWQPATSSLQWRSRFYQKMPRFSRETTFNVPMKHNEI